MSMLDREYPGPTYSDLLARSKHLEAEVERLREALEWYAGDGSTYDGIDVGQRARAALTAQEKTDG